MSDGENHSDDLFRQGTDSNPARFNIAARRKDKVA